MVVVQARPVHVVAKHTFMACTFFFAVQTKFFKGAVVVALVTKVTWRAGAVAVLFVAGT